MRINEYKNVVRAKDEEITTLKEHNRNQDKLTKEYASKTNSNSYELDSTKKKLAESKHHQDLLTKRLREYEDIVRVINKNLKQNTSDSGESAKNVKSKEREIETYKARNKVLEEELHKREEIILNFKSELKKLKTELSHREEEIDKLKVQGSFDTTTLELDKKTRDYNAQMEVIKEMVNGLKAQLKAKEMDGYRQETKIISLQSQIDTIKVREKQLEAQLGYTGNERPNLSPAVVHKTKKIKPTSKGKFESADESYSKSNKRVEGFVSSKKGARETPSKSKPLIKSGIKVQKKTNADESDEDPLSRIMNTKLKHEPVILNRKPSLGLKNDNNKNPNKYKPDMNKSMFSEKSDNDDLKASQKRNKYDIDSDDDKAETQKSPKLKRKDSGEDSDHQSDDQKNAASKLKRKASDVSSRKSSRSNERNKSRL